MRDKGVGEEGMTKFPNFPKLLNLGRGRTEGKKSAEMNFREWTAEEDRIVSLEVLRLREDKPVSAQDDQF